MKPGRVTLERIIKSDTPFVETLQDRGLYAASSYGNVEVVKVLLEFGASKNASHDDGTSAMSVAAENGRVPVVRALIEAGADMNAARSDGATPLLIAAGCGRLEVVR